MPKPLPATARPPQQQPAAAPEPTPESAPPAAAPPEPQPTHKRRKPHWKKRRSDRPEVSFPADALELQQLDLAALNLVIAEAHIRLGRAKSQRAELVGQPSLDQQTLANLNSAIAWYGPLLHCLLHRRTQLRAEARRAQGRMLEQAEAIALAVDELLHPNLYARVLERAQERIDACAADLQGSTPSQPAPELPPGSPPADLAAPD